MDKFQEAALRQHLIDTVVNNDVIAPMERANWTQGAYQQETTAGQPGGNAPQAVAPNQMGGTPGDNPLAPPLQGQQTQPNSLDFEQFRDSNGLYAGKYKTPEELVKGMRNVVDMAKQAFAERDELRSRIAQPTTVPAPSAPVATSVAETHINDGVTNLDSVLNQIVEEGGLLDAQNAAMLRDAVIKLTEDRAKNVVSAKDAEEQKWNHISEMMEIKYPGSSHRADELHLYVQSEPTVSAAVAALLQQGKEFEATEFAWRLMTSSSPSPSPAVTPAQVNQEMTTARDLVRQEAVDAARKDAGVITSAGGGVHEAPPTGPSRDDIMQAAAYGRTTADWSQWRRTALANHLDFDSPLFRT